VIGWDKLYETSLLGPFAIGAPSRRRRGAGAPQLISPPVITGEVRDGEEVSLLNAATWSPLPSSLTFSWYRIAFDVAHTRELMATGVTSYEMELEDEDYEWELCEEAEFASESLKANSNRLRANLLEDDLNAPVLDDDDRPLVMW
jgi:hypothetical protein